MSSRSFSLTSARSAALATTLPSSTTKRRPESPPRRSAIKDATCCGGVRASNSARATAARYGVEVMRRPPYTGVWSGNRKLGAIGVKLAGGVTTHGVALNVTTDLRWFDRITPCGIDGAGVASLQTLGAPGLTPAAVAPVLAHSFASAFGSRLHDAGPLEALVQRLMSETAAA